MPRKRSIAAVIIAGTATFLTACSPAIGDAQPFTDSFGPLDGKPQHSQSSTPEVGISEEEVTSTSHREELLSAFAVERGKGQVNVAYLPGARLSDELVSIFNEITGETIVQNEAASLDAVPEDAELVLGVDNAQVPHATAYGRDDICVMADISWFSANNVAMPTTADEVATMAEHLVIPAADTTFGNAFVEMLSRHTGDASQWLASAQGVGAMTAPTYNDALTQWSAASSLSWLPDATNGNYPLIVAPQSLAAQARDNTGTQSYARLIPGTCIQRIVHIAPAGDAAPEELSGAAKNLITYLTSDAGQALLNYSPWVTPLAGTPTPETADAPAWWFLTPDPASLER
ncbi:hypothetical protein [Schaalia suimastitidis]|uniref:hypothetical protein n=1 Tax=Schaalia suimastitidis TaxID=121163 RepID=UPI0004262657|nr:hypothetical protein [Schaalia suimastitidis]